MRAVPPFHNTVWGQQSMPQHKKAKGQETRHGNEKKPPAPAQAGTGGHKARRINQANGFSVGYGSDAGRL